MRKQINLLITCLMVWGCFACSEDKLTPSDPNHTFAPKPGAQDEELRREFFDKYNCYILFNDTLRHDYMGTDEDGDAFYDTELLDPNWTIYGPEEEDFVYSFQYFTTVEEKRERAEYMGDVVELLEKHNLTKPYSILVVKEIKGTNYNEEDTYYAQLSKNRCFVIDLTEVDDSENAKYLLAAGMAGSGLASKYAQEFAPFFNLTIEAMGYDDYGWPHYGDDDEEDFKYLGLLEYDSYYYPSKANDVSAYLSLLLTRTPEEVERKFRRYEIILQKYAIIKEIADKAGIKY